VPRRLLTLVLAALTLLAAAGCADEVSPALRVGDRTVGNDALLDEVAEWAGNPTLLEAVQFPAGLVEGDAPGSYSASLVGFILRSRIGFELHRAEFEARGLEIDDQVRQEVRDQLFSDPAMTEQVFADFSKAYGDRLVDDVARQIAVQDELGEEYEAWSVEAFARDDIELNPRYGTWDSEAGDVVPPEGPIQRGGADPLTPVP